MIIKSMSRKAPTFGQLIDYIGRNSDPQTGTVFARNLYHSGRDTQAVAGQFLDNYRYLPARKNGNALYHEVIVLEQQDHLSKNQIELALIDLAETYCAKRAPHQLAWGRVHHDTDYPHIHLMISSNAVRSDRRVRMDKGQFTQLQKSLEVHKEQHFPELVDGRVYQKQPHDDRPKVKNAEGELVWRTGTPSNKHTVAKRMQQALEAAAGQAHINASLREAGFDLYKRGKTVGVVDQATGRKYRLRTLGLETLFTEAMRARIKEPNLQVVPKTSTKPQRTSAPSIKPSPQITNSSKEDPRAASLKRDRAHLNAQARELLDGFERDEENER